MPFNIVEEIDFEFPFLFDVRIDKIGITQSCDSIYHAKAKTHYLLILCRKENRNIHQAFLLIAQNIT